MIKNYDVIIQFVLPLTTFYRPRAQRSDVYKRDAFVTSWRFHNRAWQLRRYDRLPETSGTLWIHRGVLTNQRCSLATGCGITWKIVSRGSRTKAIAVSKFREKLSPANWVQGVTAISRKISRSWAPKNGVQHATVIYPIPRYTQPRYIGSTLYLANMFQIHFSFLRFNTTEIDNQPKFLLWYSVAKLAY